MDTKEPDLELLACSASAMLAYCRDHDKTNSLIPALKKHKRTIDMMLEYDQSEKDMKILRNRIYNYVGYATMERLFEMENEVVSDFFLNGVAFCISGFCNLKYIDSSRRNLAHRLTNETVIRIEDELSYVEDLESLKKIEVTEVDGFYKLRLFRQIISVGQVHFVYLYIKKDLIK